MADLALLEQLCRGDFPGDKEAQAASFWRQVRVLAPYDTLAYGLYVHGDEADFFKLVAYARHLQVISEACDRGGASVIITPPEHAKSLFARWYVERWLGSETEKHFEDPNHPAPCCIYAMNAAAQATRQGKAIGATIEGNRRFKELFPNCKPDKGWGWNSEQYYLQRRVPRPDPSLYPVGVTGPIQGMRAGLGVVDDPTDQQDARSPKTLQAQAEWRLGVYSDRLTDNAVQIDIFTRWSKTDLYSYLSKDTFRNIIVMPARTEETMKGYWEQHPELGVRYASSVLWPEVWPNSRLDAKKREKMLLGDGGLWQLAYLCSPERAEGTMFKRAWFRYGMPMEAPVGA